MDEYNTQKTIAGAHQVFASIVGTGLAPVRKVAAHLYRTVSQRASPPLSDRGKPCPYDRTKQTSRKSDHPPTIAALILAAGSSSRMQHGQESYHKLLLPLGQGTVLSHVIAATLASQARPIILILGYQSAQIRTSLMPYLGGGKPIDSNTIERHPRREGSCAPPSEQATAVPTYKHRGGPKLWSITKWACATTRVSSDEGRAQDPSLQDSFLIAENTVYAQGMSTSLHKGIQVLMNQNNDLEHSTIQCDGTLVLLGDQPLITPVLLNQLIEMKYTTGKRIIAPFYNGKRGHPVLFDADLFPELLTISGDEGARSVIERHRTEMGMLPVDNSQLWYDVDTWEAYQQVLHIWQEQQK